MKAKNNLFTALMIACALLVAASHAQNMRVGVILFWTHASDLQNYVNNPYNSSNPINQQIEYYRANSYTDIVFLVLPPADVDPFFSNQANRIKFIKNMRQDIMGTRPGGPGGTPMNPIPYIPSLSALSYQDWYPQTTREPLNSKYAFPGYCWQNQGACNDFNMQLDDIYRAFTHTYPHTYPTYINIGHDEILHNIDFHNSPPFTIDQVAQEIIQRIWDINSKFNTNVQIMIWGDSFLPSDNGERLGYCGDTATGSGGVLDRVTSLIDKNRIIVCPWGYGEYLNYVRPDFTSPNPSYLPFDKFHQIRYLQKMGFKYIITTGENGASVVDGEWIQRHLQSIYEWVYAVQRLDPSHTSCLGYMNICYNDFTHVENGNRVGYTVPVTAYAQNYANKIKRPYSRAFFKNLKYLDINNANPRGSFSTNLKAPPGLVTYDGVDYNNDGTADISVTTASGEWIIDTSGNGFGQWNWYSGGYGDLSTIALPNDYDGDGRTDLSQKADFNNGTWLIDFANNNYGSWDRWDLVNYCPNSYVIPVPGDYDGDGRIDLAGKIDDGRWWIDLAKNGFGSWDVRNLNGWGSNSIAIPVPGDYDGDGITDLAVKTNTNNGDWYVDFSSNGFGSKDFCSFGKYGGTNSIPYPGDYNGDGITDFCVKAWNGISKDTLKIKYAKSGGGYLTPNPWDVKVYQSPHPNDGWGGAPADYDGDGKTDFAEKSLDNNGTWYIDYAKGGFGTWNVSNLVGYGGSEACPVK